MKKNFDHEESFNKMHKNVLDVLSLYLVEKDYDKLVQKCEDCKKNKRVFGENSECYGCMVNDENTRKKLDGVIDTTPLKEVFAYQNRLNNIANKNNIRKYKLVCEVLEAAIYTKMI